MDDVRPQTGYSNPRALWQMLALLFCAMCVVVGLAVAWLRHYAEPIARRRIVENLEAKLHCAVELDQVHLAFRPALEVNGTGLRIMAIGNQRRAVNGGTPMLVARSFQFTSTLGDLLFHRQSAITAYAQDLVLTIPAANDRAPLDQRNPDPSKRDQPRDSTFLNRLIATNSTLVLENADPAKPPIVFPFDKLVLQDPGKNLPFVYETILLNPKPIGEIHSVGHVGPWNFASPRDSPVDGNYTFDRTDLSTITGISGTLTSEGHIAGTLGAMAVHGTADTPDFALDISAHSFPVHSEFDGLVDGTNGNVALQHVVAHFLKTSIDATGLVVRSGTGHKTSLDIRQLTGRAEDLLTLFSKSRPALLSSAITASGHVEVPPGKQRLILKLQANGTGSLAGVRFSSPSLQQSVDALSERAEDHARQAKDHPQNAAIVAAAITGTYRIGGGNIDITDLRYTMPGAVVLMEGRYPLVDRELDFRGVARTIASASHMETGFKSLLLKPISPFFKKNGAGMEIPVSFTGDKASPKFALDMKNRKADAAGPGSLPAVPRR